MTDEHLLIFFRRVRTIGLKTEPIISYQDTRWLDADIAACSFSRA
jgi:hypothetical protein